MKRREIAAGLALLAFASSLCLAGLRAIDKALFAKEQRNEHEQ